MKFAVAQFMIYLGFCDFVVVKGFMRFNFLVLDSIHLVNCQSLGLKWLCFLRFFQLHVTYLSILYLEETKDQIRSRLIVLCGTID